MSPGRKHREPPCSPEDLPTDKTMLKLDCSGASRPQNVDASALPHTSILPLEQNNVPFQLRDTHTTVEDLPPNTILLHACNCVGRWGSGVAKDIAEAYPRAAAVYARHCRANNPETLVGRCLLIQPQPGEQRAVWIACLFTSRGYGRASARRCGRDEPDIILDQTIRALLDLRDQLDVFSNIHVGRLDRALRSDKTQVFTGNLRPNMHIYSPRFNSGRFAVPWYKTEAIVMESFGGWSGRWYVLSDR